MNAYGVINTLDPNKFQCEVCGKWVHKEVRCTSTRGPIDDEITYTQCNKCNSAFEHYCTERHVKTKGLCSGTGDVKHICYPCEECEEAWVKYKRATLGLPNV